ncbi:MAG: LexA family transcriptional regulator [Flavobacterium sp.]|nr:LexA family transcriptional regulator [Flavobacterium sp.]
MSIFSDNLRYLRENNNESQREMAEKLDVKRGRYEPWESGKVEPPYEYLVKISRRFAISIDVLLTTNLRKISVNDFIKLENNRILLPITVDKDGENKIEIVTQKAKAGYAAGGYADFSFISELDHISLPWLSRNEKYRTFPIDGDSMPPHNNKSYIIGRYVEKLGDVVNGKTYIVVTRNNEMVYKRLNKKEKNIFMLNSDNSFYQPYEVRYSDIAEIWEYAGSLEQDSFQPEKPDKNSLEDVIRKLQKDIMEIRQKVL